MFFNAKQDLDYALAFTELYKSEPDPSLREAKCLAMQVPYVLTPIGEDELIVGCMKHGFVGFSPQYGGSYTYYYWDDRVAAALDEVRNTVEDGYVKKIEEMRTFWRAENTEEKVDRLFHQRYSTPMLKRIVIYDQFYRASCRIAGMNVDLDMLVHEGLSGLRRRNAAYREKNGDSTFYQALDLSIDVLADACRSYAENAQQLLKGELTEQRRQDLTEIRDMLAHLADGKPRNFKEALQLIWIYAICSDLMNFGRLDNALADFYVHDIDSGAMDEEEAIRWLSSFYRAIIRVSKVHDSRIIIGGKGRKDPEAADRLAFAFIETSKRVMDVVPQLTLRYYKGMNEELMVKTLENIEAGAVYPIVYSDDATIPAIQKIYGIDEEEACKWVPLGCGEYVMEGCGAATPNSSMTLSQALDIVLHEGYNSISGTLFVKGMKPVSSYKTFDELFEAYSDVLRPACEETAYYQKLNYQLAGEEAAYLHISLLTHDSVELGKPAFAGGCRYLSETDEVFGFVTCADSLTAIKKCVYEDKLFTLEELVKMLDANFEGYEKEREALLSAPKYGNDDDYADEIAVRVFNNISELHEEAGRKFDLPERYNIVSVNNSGSAERGAACSATPCGRKRSEPLSNGNSPSIGGDKNGLTATLNSMRKIDPVRHVGVVHNIRFNKDMLHNNFDTIKMLLETFYENGGAQTNLSSIGKDDLEQAMIHPERYRNLLVRIGGFSARFVELDPIVQHELLLRTTVEEC